MTRRVAIWTGTVLVASLLGCSNDNPASPSPESFPSSSDTARYRVTFQATWSRNTHPSNFPSNPHFSRLVGGTHNSSAIFWAEGASASTGMRDMAERGRTSPLDDEIRAAMAIGTADQVILGGDVDPSPGSASLEFDMQRAFPLVTLVTMVAPSPDWFVGVAGLALFENGEWVPSRNASLLPWDAGTDSGVTFTSADAVTSPPMPIARITTAPLAPNGLAMPMGTFTFTRVR